MKRPWPISVLAWLFIVLGSAGSVFAIVQLAQPSSNTENPAVSWLVLLVRLIAVFCGVFILRGYNWARWLAAAWMAYHVVISIGAAQKLLVHGGLFIALLFMLFLPISTAWFRSAKSSVPAA